MATEAPATVQDPPDPTRPFLCFLAAALALVLGWELILFLSRIRVSLEFKPGITRLNSKRIRIGMTRAEVEAILGKPAGDYRTGPTDSLPGREASPYWTLEAADVTPNWRDDAGSLWVRFDDAGRVDSLAGTPKPAVFFWDARKVTINAETFARIKNGMPRTEVEFILGGRPGDYRTDRTVAYPDRPDEMTQLEKKVREYLTRGTEEFWESDEGCLFVELTDRREIDSNGWVKSKQYWPGKKPEKKAKSAPG
jgi:hypothetical protein